MANDPLTISIATPEEVSVMLMESEEEGLEVYTEEPQIVYSSLAAHIIKTFENNKDAKRDSGIEDEIFDSLRDYNGVYSPKDRSLISSEGGSDIFMNLTATKSRAAMSWIRDILLSVNEDSFSILPTPLPTLPEDLSQQLEEAFQKEFNNKTSEIKQEGIPVTPEVAQDTVISLNKTKRDIREAVLDYINLTALDEMKVIEKKIKDDLKEGKWDQALSDFIEDFCIFPAAFMKGPVISKKEILKWSNGTPVVQEDYIYLNKRVSPIDVYPSPSATSIQEGDFVEHMRLSASELYSLKGIKNYKDEAIDRVLEYYQDRCSWLDTGVEDEKADEEKRGDSYDADTGIYHGLHYWGLAKTADVEEWGLVLPETEDPNKQWEIEAILVGNEVIKCKLNSDPLKRRPYYKASYQNIPGSFWGRSLPNLMRDIQRMCNACARALANNMGLAAGPQIGINIDRLADSGEIEAITPLKIWQFTNDPTGAGGKPIDIFQIPSIAGELLAVYDKFEQKADDATGIPRYSYGNQNVGGAAQALADYEPIVTPTGLVPIGVVRIGDKINNTYGGVSSVTGVFPQGESDIFRLKFSNGESVDCDMNHRWSVKDHTDREFRTLTTEEILDKGLFRKTKLGKKNPKGFRPKWMLPFVAPVAYAHKEVKIDPYTFGAILGDGDSRARLTSMDQEVFDRIPYELGKPNYKKNNKAWSQTIKGIKKDLKQYLNGAVCYNKFIPEDYLINSVSVRTELLKGMMDTDGCISNNGECFYYSTSERLANDFKILVRSLGGTVTSVQRYVDSRENRSDGFRVHFNIGFCPANLERKAKNYNKKKLRHTYIVGIEYIGRSKATCITVDSDNSLFLTKSFIPTHNTASGLSMLLESATKSIKDAIRHIDTGLIIPRVEYQFYWNLINNQTKYSGDINVIAHGSNTLTLKGAQQAKRQEFLQITANQSDQELMGPEGRAELIRQLAKDLGLTTEIVPSRLELRKKIQEVKQQASQQQSAKMQEIQQKIQGSLQATQMQVEGQKQMHEQTQLVKLKDMNERVKREERKDQIEAVKLQIEDAAVKEKAASNIKAQETKREIARTNAAVSLTKNKTQ